MKHLISGIIYLIIVCVLLWVAIEQKSGTFVYITTGIGVLLGLFWVYVAWYEYKNDWNNW